MTELLNVDLAIAGILKAISVLSDEAVPLMDALGRVLAEDVHSEVDLPPFANSSMDGFAVRAADTTGERPVLRVVMDIPAGLYPEQALGPGEAARIMTGAALPPGADAVVPVEETDAQWDAAQGTPLPAQVVIHKAARAGANVRPVGEDVRSGAFLLRAGTVLRPQDIGLLAALGMAYIRAYRRPRVAILSSGDELVGVEEVLVPGKIRDVNSYTLAGLVLEHGGEPLRLPPARDSLVSIREMFSDALARQPDMILSSAGVSVGAADLIRTVLAEYGRVDFWRINLRPGKPLAFGHIQAIPFFGLPGNPVSAMVTFDVLVRPALLKQAGRSDEWPLEMAVLAEDLVSDGRRSYLRVRLTVHDGELRATLTGTQSSGALSSMVAADGLLIIPEGVMEAKAGEVYPVRVLRRVGNPDKTRTSTNT